MGMEKNASKRKKMNGSGKKWFGAKKNEWEQKKMIQCQIKSLQLHTKNVEKIFRKWSIIICNRNIFTRRWQNLTTR
jgi:hypothetical protein